MSLQALKEGEKLQDNPDYYRVLKRSDGGGLALSNFAKKQPVVLFFYPRECNWERVMCQQARQLPQQHPRLQRDQFSCVLK